MRKTWQIRNCDVVTSWNWNRRSLDLRDASKIQFAYLIWEEPIHFGLFV